MWLIFKKAIERRQANALRCSFCSKSKGAVAKLISGPNVYICDECVALCSRILAEETSRR